MAKTLLDLTNFYAMNFEDIDGSKPFVSCKTVLCFVNNIYDEADILEHVEKSKKYDIKTFGFFGISKEQWEVVFRREYEGKDIQFIDGANHFNEMVINLDNWLSTADCDEVCLMLYDDRELYELLLVEMANLQEE